MLAKRTIVSAILLLDGILMILLAFVHLLATPLIEKWLSRELTVDVLTKVSPAFLLDHIVVGILLIPFGISTLYSAAGIRAGQPWARVVATTNAIVVLILPLLIVVLMGPGYFSATPFLMAAILITIIGVSMFIPLIWLRSGPGRSLH